MSLSTEIEAAVDGYEETRGRDSTYTDWASRAGDLEVREAIALQALTANKCWICPTVERGKPEFVAAYASTPYGGTKIIRESFHADPWVCLREGLRWLDAVDSESDRETKP